MSAAGPPAAAKRFIWVGPGDLTRVSGSQGSETVEPGDELDRRYVTEIWGDNGLWHKIACLDEDGEVLELGAASFRRDRVEEVLDVEGHIEDADALAKAAKDEPAPEVTD